MSDNSTEWMLFDGGNSLGQRGLEGGDIIRDIEHPGGARMLLERDCLRVPYAITSQVYGWMSHTRFFADEPTAIHAFEQMQADVAAIVALVPGEDDVDASAKADAVGAAVDVFMERYA